MKTYTMVRVIKERFTVKADSRAEAIRIATRGRIISDHTKEPWGYVKENIYFTIIGPDNTSEIGQLLREEDAQRIVACVNACLGIGTEWLGKNAGMLQSLVEDIQNVSCQLDDEKSKIGGLIKLVKPLCSSVNGDMYMGKEWEEKQVSLIRSAIANEEKDKP